MSFIEPGPPPAVATQEQQLTAEEARLLAAVQEPGLSDQEKKRRLETFRAKTLEIQGRGLPGQDAPGGVTLIPGLNVPAGFNLPEGQLEKIAAAESQREAPFTSISPRGRIAERTQRQRTVSDLRRERVDPSLEFDPRFESQSRGLLPQETRGRSERNRGTLLVDRGAAPFGTFREDLLGDFRREFRETQEAAFGVVPESEEGREAFFRRLGSRARGTKRRSPTLLSRPRATLLGGDTRARTLLGE